MIIKSRPALMDCSTSLSNLRNLVNRRPVRNQESPGSQAFAFQNVRQQIFVPVHLRAVPAAVGNHDAEPTPALIAARQGGR